MLTTKDVEIIPKNGAFDVYEGEIFLFSLAAEEDVHSALVGYNLGMDTGKRIGEGVAQRRMLRALGMEGQATF